MKRAREITIIHYRRRVKKRQAATAEVCPVCGNGSDLMTVEAAAKLTGIGRSMLNSWINDQQVHATRSNTSHLCICRRCLSERVTSSVSGLAEELPAEAEVTRADPKITTLRKEASHVVRNTV